ncbi:integrase arm-type DNA-binding domain-containing protein [Uliginosibacterium sp. H3]|uniref:Integrase arm-type DNA-binding domain-containing protein n=1 Tax=Uliginosibacterium silvisoli TaxID=3114758 RepID=A0ABU6K5C1_9RHOO|nr:integrase arm-type DNA-binding domain-containing protein [Uliginosibacterium sp. H3]
MALSDKTIRALCPADKIYRKADTGGLEIEVKPQGRKTWRLRYRVRVGAAWVARMGTLGTYPDVSLAEARDRAAAMRALIKQGFDPVHHARMERAGLATDRANSFEAVCRRALAEKSRTYKPDTLQQMTRGLEAHFFPKLGTLPVRALSAAELREVTAACNAAAPSHCRKLLRFVVSALRTAKVDGLVDTNVGEDLRGLFPRPESTPRAAHTGLEAVSGLMRAVYSLADPRKRNGLTLLAILMPRPSELCAMRWDQIDFTGATWTVDAIDMKMKRQHVQPLPTQALAILRELKMLSGGSDWVFPLGSDGDKHIARQNLNSWLRELGDASKGHTAHGFRSMGSTLLHEAMFNSDAVELSLAHALPGAVRRIYARGGMLDYRRAMLARWAGFLDAVGRGGTVDDAFAMLGEGQRLAA